MKLEDFTANTFFENVTFESDSAENKEGKVVLPDGDFALCGVLFRIELEIKKLRSKK